MVVNVYHLFYVNEDYEECRVFVAAETARNAVELYMTAEDLEPWQVEGGYITASAIPKDIAGATRLYLHDFDQEDISVRASQP